MGGVRGAVRRKVSRHGHCTIGDVDVVDSAVEQGEGGLRLVIGDFVAGFVDAREAEVAVLLRLAVLDAVVREGDVTGGGELSRVGVVERVGDCLAAEPVADVVRVAVEKVHPHPQVEDCLQIFEEIGVDEVAGVLEAPVDIAVGCGVVEADAQSVLNKGCVEVVLKIGWWSWIVGWVANVIST